jgi:2'-5' RNA ligase
MRAGEGLRELGGGESGRLFFALWPSDAVKGEFARWGDALNQSCGGRVARRENIHLTLVFLGDVALDRLEELKSLACKLKISPFGLSFVGTREVRKKRLVWTAPLETPAPLIELVSRLEQALKESGFVFDARPYSPHLTLIRKTRRSPEPYALSPVDWQVRDFVLVRSQLGSSGSNYEVIGRWDLG